MFIFFNPTSINLAVEGILVIERRFEIVTATPPDKVIEILMDPELLLPLWSIYESMELKGKNTADAVIRLAGTNYTVKVTISSTTTGKGGGSVKVVAQGQVNISMTFNIEPKGLGSLVSCQLVVRAGFFRERLIAPSIATFMDDLKNKLVFQLPSMAEAVKARVPTPAKPTPPEIKPIVEEKPAPPPPKVEKERPAPPKPAKPPAPSKPREGIILLEDPRALEDEVTVGLILLKSELVETYKINIPSDKLIDELDKLRSKYKEVPIYVNIRGDDKSVKILLIKNEVKGVRIDLSDGRSLNGVEALKEMNKDESVKGRVYVFKIPPNVPLTES